MHWRERILNTNFLLNYLSLNKRTIPGNVERFLLSMTHVGRLTLGEILGQV